MPKNIDALLRSAGEEKLIELAGQDPGLCTNLLHMANTCYSKPGDHIETIGKAVKVVGYLPLIQLVGVSYATGIILEDFSSLEHPVEYFLHSQEISLGCRILSEVSGVKQHGCEVLSVVGLIHDIGRLVILLAGKAAVSAGNLLSYRHKRFRYRGLVSWRGLVRR
jgi:HD-like signal output (HDOD) protein